MSIFLSKLSQNYLELLTDDEYYDTTIEVGKDPDVKIFRAHMNILCCRSPYLRQTLASNKKNSDSVLTHISLPNISVETFRIILKYIYGGVLSLDMQDTFETFETLIAAENLLLQELVDHLQNYFIENESEWMEQHFELIYRTSFKSNHLLELQQFCTDFMEKFPEKIFKSFDFTSLPEKPLIQLIKRDDLQMKEIEIWEHLLKWGLAQNQTLVPDPNTPNTWSDNDFETLENTLRNCLPFIRFFSLSSKEFLQKVRPYKKLLKKQLYEELLSSHLNPDIKETEEIIGGYNPIIWLSSSYLTYGKTKDSFVFSFKNMDNFKDSIISYVKNVDYALNYHANYGPCFGSSDLITYNSNEDTDYDVVYCDECHYEKKLRDTETRFSIEDYEIYQIVKRQV
ncbi:BTB/POZ protein [Rhizophagus clarus]|uniref:BTB/POZ protein n=1 Tax=Rhizophagus clarus TaxID=94130 RepID=A0A8H3MDK2_9GLOM|nr:BTB/POZ protein [Rhizophagus clarus]